MVAFTYRPKFVDIRVKKPDPGKTERAPQDRACDHAGCRLKGQHRAPKSRRQDNEFWWFCTDHAGEYNRRWNYFEGMSPGEYDSFARAEVHGHRPTWAFQASRNDRESAVKRKFQAFRAERGGHDGVDPVPKQKMVPRLQRLALDVLDLDETVTPEGIRARYTELVKRFHPDVNGGDRSAEAQLHRVIRAYQTLKAAGWV
jgi:hypothetical protein